MTDQRGWAIMLLWTFSFYIVGFVDIVSVFVTGHTLTGITWAAGEPHHWRVIFTIFSPVFMFPLAMLGMIFDETKG